MFEFPRMFRLRQRFPAAPPLDIRATLRRDLAPVTASVKPGGRVAVAVGSRGISNLQSIVGAVVETLRSAGARPFIVPAMGSHGGATPEGQSALLAEYGITGQALGVPLDASMEVQQLGATPDGVAVHFSRAALGADGIIVVNRVKPHTDFRGAIGSGLVKMIAIGLGKRTGAATCHLAAMRLGYERVIRSVARVSLGTAPILCGVAIVEDAYHQTARLRVLRREEIEAGEETLFVEARDRMPRLPFDEMDLLIVDRLGKNISGTGMDTNIIGRGVQGYSLDPAESGARPVIRRLFVRELTPETHGNAIGLGLADLTTTRLVRAMDRHVTYVNAMTSLTPQGAKIPVHFDTDREAIQRALESLPLADPAAARVVRIADTLTLDVVEVSTAFAEAIPGRDDLEAPGAPTAMPFDATENLLPLGR